MKALADFMGVIAQVPEWRELTIDYCSIPYSEMWAKWHTAELWHRIDHYPMIQWMANELSRLYELEREHSTLRRQVRNPNRTADDLAWWRYR